MSYRLVVLGDLPLAYWRLEESSGTTIADLSGFGYTGTLTGTLAYNQAGLTSGGTSAIFDTTDRFTAPVPDVMVQGSEDKAFALECWVKVDAPVTSRRRLIGRASAGVVITPGGIEFSITSTDGNTYEAFYTVTDWDQPLHIIANYVGRNLGLIVNGEEGTNADFFGSFANTSSTMYVGGYTTTSSTAITLDEVAIYRRTLDITMATRHYDVGTQAISPMDIAQLNSGVYYGLDDSTVDVAFRYVEDSAAGFLLGTNDPTIVVTDDYLYPTDAGTHTSDIQYVGDLGSVAGSRIDWKASSAVSVEVSLDMGVTWTACTNHAQIPGIGPNTDLTGKFIQFRKVFGSLGTLTYIPFFDRLSVVIYRSKAVQANVAQGVTVYGNPVLAEASYSPMLNRKHMGVTFPMGSYMTIPSPEGGTQTVDFWYKRNSDTASEWQYIIDSRTASTPDGIWFAIYGTAPGAVSVGPGATVYVNGVAKVPTLADFPLGVWVHVVIVFPTSVTDPIFLNARNSANETGTHSIAHLVLYPGALTARQASTLYGMARGLVNNTVLDSAGTISESPTGIKVYSLAWSMSTSGTS